MTAVTFDTLRFVERLTASGVPEAQAKAMSEALKEAQAAVDYATREDVYRIVSEAKWDVLKWVVGLALAQISLLVGVLIKLL
ncbi:MAG: DUF1640 domain-containing protein [bacterium]